MPTQAAPTSRKPTPVRIPLWGLIAMLLAAVALWIGSLFAVRFLPYEYPGYREPGESGLGRFGFERRKRASVRFSLRRADLQRLPAANATSNRVRGS
jgi:hypothetical protein